MRTSVADITLTLRTSNRGGYFPLKNSVREFELEMGDGEKEGEIVQSCCGWCCTHIGQQIR